MNELEDAFNQMNAGKVQIFEEVCTLNFDKTTKLHWKNFEHFNFDQ